MSDAAGQDHRKSHQEALRGLEAAQTGARQVLEADAGLQDTYGKLLTTMRLSDSRRSGTNPKTIPKALASAPEAVRQAAALLGPRDGVARGVIENLTHFRLDPGARFLAALACVQVEPGPTLMHLAQAGLDATEHLLAVAEEALPRLPALDFEEQKKAEIVYAAAGSQDERQVLESRRAFNEARGVRSAHIQEHALRHLPEALLADREACFRVLRAALGRDPFGSLEALRAMGEVRPLRALDLRQRLELLDLAAAPGLGLASNYLDLFELPEDPGLRERLQAVFVTDLTAGSSIYGVYALEGAQNYPFGLRRIEPALPRRVSNAEALAWLRKDEVPSILPTSYSATEIGNAVDFLQEREVQRFLELLKADIYLEWKACFSEAKLQVVFGDLELKIRNILFLVAKALFRENAAFEQLLAAIATTFPAAPPAQVSQLASHHFFLEALGLNPAMLFGLQRGARAQKAPIEEVDLFRLRFLLHVGMALHLHVGEILFQSVPIAWNLLQHQGEGGLDAVVQEVAGFFDIFDLLLVLAGPLVRDPGLWTLQVVEALAQGAAQVPLDRPGVNLGVTLRLMTRDAIGRHRDTLNGYCLQMLRRRAAAAGLSPTTVIQSLRLPRSRTDKLFTFLEEDRKRT